MVRTRPPQRRNPVARRVRLYRLMFDRRFASHMPSYLFQCGLATLSMVAIILLVDVIFRPVVVVAAASTAFIVFVVPQSVAATPRKVIGGHVFAVIVGSAFAGIIRLLGVDEGLVGERLVLQIAGAVSVGFAMFVMVITNTEHPPAAATSLGLVFHEWTVSSVVFIVSAAIVLSAVRIALRPKLVNLL